MSQLANTLSKVTPRGEVKEHCKAITLRSGKELEEPKKSKGNYQRERDKMVKKENKAKSAQEVEKTMSKLFPDNPPPYISQIQLL